MKNKALFTIGTVLGFISVYPILVWIYLFNAYSSESHIERQTIFCKQFLFGIDIHNINKIHLLFIVSGIISVFIFGLFLSRLNQITQDKKSKKGKSILYLAFLILFSFSTLLNIWSIL